MKGLPILAAAVGVAAIAALIGYFGAGPVMRSLLAVGGLGFAVICAIHIVLVAVMGLAWGGLIPGAPAWTAIWGRLVRDSGSELLPFWQVGGYILGARALALTGVSGTAAAASTIVDVTFEFISQLAFTALGLALLIQLQPDSVAATPVMIGLVIAVVAAAGFLFVQRRGVGFVLAEARPRHRDRLADARPMAGARRRPAVAPSPGYPTQSRSGDVARVTAF